MRACRIAVVLAAAWSVYVPAAAAHTEVPAALRDVGFEQRLGAAVPRDLVLRDESDHPVTLGSVLGRVPVLMMLVQYRCPNLCPLALEGLAAALRETGLQPGDDYAVVTLGLDPRDGPNVAAARKRLIVSGYFKRDAAAGWHVLTGPPSAIHAIATAVGFHYTYDRATDQYAHPTGLIVLAPNGRIARYLFGIDFTARDLRLALTEASGGRIGTVVDQLLLACYRYDAATGRYTPVVMAGVRLAGVVTVFAMGAWLTVMFRGERRRGQATARASAREAKR